MAPTAPANPFAVPSFAQDPFLTAFSPQTTPAAPPLGMHQGSRAPLPDEKLIRESMDSLPDDKIVNVKLWETDGRATLSSEPIMDQDGVLMSAVKRPLLWIPYGGHWYMETTDPASKKVYRKSFDTRGEPAPASWRPRIGGDEMVDKVALREALRELGVGTQQQAQGTPAGSIPSTVYGDVQGQITKLETKIETLQAALDTAKDARNEALRKADNEGLKLEMQKTRNTELVETIRRLEEQVAHPPATGKPDWLSAVEAMSKKGDGEGFTTKDAMAFQERMFGLIEKLKHGTDGEKQDAFSQLNSSLDFIKKVQGAAGIGKAADSVEDTLGKVAKIAGGIDKGLDYLASRDRKKSEADAGKKKPAGTASSGSHAPGSSSDDPTAVINFAMNRILAAFREGAAVPQEDWSKAAEPVAGKIVASSIWVTEMGLSDTDAEVAFFLDQIKKDPEGILVAFGGKQSPPVPEGFCLEVARYYRLMNGMPEKQPTKPAKPPEAAAPPVASPAAPPAQPAGDNGGPKPPGSPEAAAPLEPPIVATGTPTPDKPAQN